MPRNRSEKTPPPEVDEWGNKVWCNHGGQRHREDGPAVEHASGSKFWYLNDRPHREDGPAREYANGDKHWYRNGQLHREDGPAVEDISGNRRWFLNGVMQPNAT